MFCPSIVQLDGRVSAPVTPGGGDDSREGPDVDTELPFGIGRSYGEDRRPLAKALCGSASWRQAQSIPQAVAKTAVGGPPWRREGVASAQIYIRVRFARRRLASTLAWDPRRVPGQVNERG